MMKKALRMSVAMAAIVFLAGCGGENDDYESDAAPEAPSADPTAAAPAGPADAARPSTVEIGDSTAQKAMDSYMALLLAGDFHGAVSLCDPDAPSTVKLREMAEGYDRAQSDGVDPELIKQMIVQDFRAITWEMVEEGEDEAVFELSSPTAAAGTVKVRRIGGVWRVVPPGDRGIPSSSGRR